MAAGTFDITDPTTLDAYTDSFQQMITTQADYYTHAGIKVTQPGVRHLTPFFAQIMDNFLKKNPKGDFDVMKWGNKDGLWGDVIDRLDPSINRDDAHRVWESLWNERAKGRKGLASSGDDDLIRRASPVGGFANVWGGIGDVTAEVFEKAGEAASSLGRWENRFTEWSPERSSRTYMEGLLGVASPKQDISIANAELEAAMNRGKPVITPTDKSVAMGPFAGLDNGLISGFMARGEDAVATDVKGIEENIDELQEAEKRAEEREVKKGQKIRDISAEAATFLNNFLQMLLEEGEDQAKSMMSRAFASLSTSAKKDVQNYLMSQ